MTSFITHSKKFVNKMSNTYAIAAILAFMAILALAGINLKILNLRRFLLVILDQQYTASLKKGLG